MDFPVESYSFLPGSRAILDLSYRSRLRNSNYAMSQQSIPTISMVTTTQQLFIYFITLITLIYQRLSRVDQKKTWLQNCHIRRYMYA